MEQTKGYWRVKGKIWRLNNTEAKDFGLTNSLSFGIQSSKLNSNFVQVGNWKSSKLNVKIKAQGDEKEIQYSEQEAIDIIKNKFKDGDSVYMNIRTEVDTYHKNLLYIVSAIYICDEAIDFNSDDFEEVNELNQSVIITETPEGEIAKLGVVNYQGAMVELETKLLDPVIKDYFIDNVKKGDLMKLSMKVVNKPKSSSSNGEVKARTTLKGKEIKSGGNNNSKERESYLEVTDVDIEKIEKRKYDSSEIRGAIEKGVYVKKDNNITEEDNDDLPY